MDPQLRLSMAGKGTVPKEYTRAVDAQLLPPRVGHNWNDQAFRKVQDKPQQLEGEFRGKRAFTAAPSGDSSMAAPDMCETAQQLVEALAASSFKKSTLRGTRSGQQTARYVTLDDKVLRFYAFFSEAAPEGGAEALWHRKVVISFYPVDETFMIEEPRIVNSGLDGGTFLKRQKVEADPRQREMFPNEPYVSLNYLNVGESVRLNATEFFIYDCDKFTRDLLTEIGVVVGEPLEAPSDMVMSDYANYKERLLSGKFGMLSQDYSNEESARAVKFVQDSGKTLRFYGLLDERGKVANGLVRRLELMLFVEDNTIAIVERQHGGEACNSLFLSRCWLPKCGSVSKLNELTFLHRANGQRAPDMGIPDPYYCDVDFTIGMTVNVLGRSVLIYDCDDFAREFMAERYGVDLGPALDVSAMTEGVVDTRTIFGGTKTVLVPEGSRSAKSQSAGQDGAAPRSTKGGDTLRFRAVLATPADMDEQHRRFAVTMHTGSCDFVLHESAFAPLNIQGGCLWKKARVPRPAPKTGPRNAPKTAEELALVGKPPYYTLEDVGVGKLLTINGLKLRLIGMDTHTELCLSGKGGASATERDATGAVVTTEHLLLELRKFLYSRCETGVKAFLRLDHDRDGFVSLPEFTEALRDFQITEDPAAAEVLFHRITPTEDTGFITPEDLMRWMDEEVMGLLPSTTGPTLRSTRPGLPTGGTAAELAEMERRAVRRRVLRELKARLDSRCWKGVEMFRLASTMPRAYRVRRADAQTLSNPSRDTVITPVQLRRCVEEVLCAIPTPADMNCLLEFFFPALPKEMYGNLRDETTEYGVSLGDFQQRYYEMTQETMLPDPEGETQAPLAKTSVI